MVSYRGALMLDEPQRLTNAEMLTLLPSPLWAMELGSPIMVACFSVAPHKANTLRLADQYLSYRLATQHNDGELTAVLRKLDRLYEPGWLRCDYEGNMIVRMPDGSFVLPKDNDDRGEVIVASAAIFDSIETIFTELSNAIKSTLG